MHIRKGLYACKGCPKDWVKHSREERDSTGLCMWYSLDKQTVCMLLLPCSLHDSGLSHWLDPNAPVRLGFIEQDFKDYVDALHLSGLRSVVPLSL